MNEYEHFKKWVNSFGVKIYYKAKLPTKKELYEIATRQEQEIERLKEELKREQNNTIYLEEKINKAIEYIENNTYKSNATEYMDLTGISELLDILKGVDKE